MNPNQKQQSDQEFKDGIAMIPDFEFPPPTTPPTDPFGNTQTVLRYSPKTEVAVPKELLNSTQPAEVSGEWSKEPWKFIDGQIVSADGYCVSEKIPDMASIDRNCALRAVKCVNACFGIPEPAAHIESLTKEIDDLKTVVNERDARIRGQVDDLAALEKKRDSLKRQLTDANSDIAKFQEMFHLISTERDELRAKVGMVEVEREELLKMIPVRCAVKFHNEDGSFSAEATLAVSLAKLAAFWTSDQSELSSLRSELAQSRESREKADEKTFNLEEEMADLRLELAQAKERVKALDWIRVEDRLPDESVDLLCAMGKEVKKGFLYCGTFYEMPDGVCEEKLIGVTHWMPLPSAPQPLAQSQQ